MNRQDLSSDLDIPDWVPPIIHPWTREKYQLAIKTRQDLNAAMIKRLACDNRMKKVWVKLPETVRSEFFRTAVMLLEHPILMQPRPSYTEVAAQLREDARVLGTRRPGKTFARLAMPIGKPPRPMRPSPKPSRRATRSSAPCATSPAISQSAWVEHTTIPPQRSRLSL